MLITTPELLLLRHGIAEERRPDRADADRALTPLGRQKTRAVLERAVALGLRADRLISSPLIRAHQTAELALAADLAPSLDLSEALAPGADPLPLLRAWLGQLQRPDHGGAIQGRLVLVGHEPDLGLLACTVLGASPGAISLRKAGLALLRFEAATPGLAGSPALPPASLRLLLSPRVLLAGG